nr:death-associated protein 1-like [Dasypus novemcinctus]
MSSPEGKLRSKAGHPPAVKAGGVRIVQQDPHGRDSKEDGQEWESPMPSEPPAFSSGLFAQGDKHFLLAAAQVAHEKPRAALAKHPSLGTQHIQRPGE